MEKRLYSAKEAACYLGLAPQTIYNQTGRKASHKFPIPFKRIGKMIRFDKKDLDRWVDSLDTTSNGIQDNPIVSEGLEQ